MARTRADLAKRALQKLSIVDALEEPSAEDGAYVRSVYDDKLEELRDEGLVYWDANAVPEAVVPALVKIVAAEIGPAFGLPFDAALHDAGLQQLERHMARAASGEQAEVLYY